MATCYRHPSRETGVSCANCGRPICPDCMTTTPVGMRCPECSKQRTQVPRLRDSAKVPRATYALIVINVAVFLAEGSSAWTFSGSPETSKVANEGGLIGSLGNLHVGVAHGQWWRIVSSGFLHDNFLHIGFNMWVLYVLGMMLEPALGWVRIVTIYSVSLLCGSLGALIVDPHTITLGASGAIFGLMGAAAVEMRARQIPLMQSGVGGLIVINLIISFSVPNISWAGHIGGLIGGALAASLLMLGDRRRMRGLAYAACAVIAVAAVVGSIATSRASEPAQSPAGFITEG